MTEPLIICAVAGDEHAADVVATGRALAEAASCRLLHVHVVAPIAPLHGVALHPGAASVAHAYEPARIEEAGRARAAEILDGAGVPLDAAVEVRTGEPARTIRALADEHDAALVVLGSRRQGAMMSTLRGSVSRALARDSPRPILIAQAGRRPGDGPVVCGVEHDDAATRRAVGAAVRLGALLGRGVALAHVLERGAASDPGRQEGAYALLDSVRPAGTDAEIALVVLEGDAPTELEALAERLEASLLVVGSHGAGPVRAAVSGTVSLDLTRTSSRPLVIVPQAA